MPFLSTILLVAIGGAIGGAARHWLSGTIGRRVGELFPWGTLAVNASGALLVGVLAAVLARPEAGGGASVGWLLLVVGVLGSYTTVSSFSLQTLALLRHGELRRAGLNVALSFGLCLAGAAAGWVGGGLLVRA